MADGKNNNKNTINIFVDIKIIVIIAYGFTADCAVDTPTSDSS